MKINEPKLTFIAKAVQNAYKKYVNLDKLDILDKSEFDLVTQVDFNVEKYLIEEIKKEYPDDNILSEETNSQTIIKDNTWTIDPIDGTYNMANGINIFGIQVSMYKDNDIYLSLIHIPLFNETFYAVKGQGAYLNNQKITANHKDLKHCIVSFGDFPHTRLDDTLLEQKIMNNLSRKIAKCRMFGAACVDFSSVAAGKTDGTIIFTKNKWDIAPGILLCREAGCLIKDLDGDYNQDSGVIIACSNETLYKAILKAAN